jgi:hypothetical protein
MGCDFQDLKLTGLENWNYLISKSIKRSDIPEGAYPLVSSRLTIDPGDCVVAFTPLETPRTHCLAQDAVGNKQPQETGDSRPDDLWPRPHKGCTDH